MRLVYKIETEQNVRITAVVITVVMCTTLCVDTRQTKQGTITQVYTDDDYICRRRQVHTANSLLT